MSGPAVSAKVRPRGAGGRVAVDSAAPPVPAVAVPGRRRGTRTRVLSAAATVAACSLLVKVVATGKEMAIAHRFGTSDAVDAFLIALVLPSFATGVVAGSVAPALVPRYLEVREREGQEAARRLLAGATGAVVLLLGVIVLLLLGVMPAALTLLASSFGSEKRELTLFLSRLFAPLVILGGLSTVWTGILNARERFAFPAVAPIALPVAVLVAVLALGPTLGVHALAAGVIVGYGLECVLVVTAARRSGVLVAPRWDIPRPELRRLGRQYLPALGGGILMGATVLVDQGMAAMLPSGSVAALAYGGKVVSMALGIGAVALGTAALPYFSHMAAREDRAGIRSAVRFHSLLVLVLSVPLVTMAVLWSEPLVDLLFHRGTFTGTDVTAVAQIQALYLLQVPFYLLVILFVRIHSALQQNRFLLTGAALNLVLNTVLNIVLMRSMGAAGIALSTSLVLLCSSLYLGTALRRTLRGSWGGSGADGAAIPLLPAGGP